MRNSTDANVYRKKSGQTLRGAGMGLLQESMRARSDNTKCEFGAAGKWMLAAGGRYAMGPENCTPTVNFTQKTKIK